MAVVTHYYCQVVEWLKIKITKKIELILNTNKYMLYITNYKYNLY